MRRGPVQHRGWSRGISRRGLLGGAAALAAAGCSGSSSGQKTSNAGAGVAASVPTVTAQRSPTPAAQVPRPGGMLRLADSAQLGNLHPQEAGGSQTEIGYNVYDHLVLWDYVNDKPDFVAAESYEVPEPIRLIYHIRQQANWQNLDPLNGRTVTSQDIDASWSAYVTDPKATGALTIHTVLTDHRETPDAKQLVQVFKAPSVPIFGPHGIAGPIPSLFAPPELWKGNQLTTKAVGSGAYVLDSFDPQSQVSLTRRPDGWNGLNRPYIDRIVYKVITDETARAAALRANQIDLLVARDKLQAGEFQSYSPNIAIDKQIDFPTALLLNASRPPFADQRVRKAIYVALDIQDLINRVALGEGTYSSFVPPHLPTDAVPEAEVKSYFPHDVKMAKDLLAAAGFDSSQALEFKYPNDPVSQTLVQTLQQQFAAIGIKTTLIPQDPTTVWMAQTVQKVDFILTAASQYTRGEDADQWLGNNYKNGAGNGNKCGWQNPETDALFEQSRTLFDKDPRHQLLLDLQRKLFAAAVPWINLYAPNRFTARWNKYHPVTDTGYSGQLGHYDWFSA